MKWVAAPDGHEPPPPSVFIGGGVAGPSRETTQQYIDHFTYKDRAGSLWVYVKAIKGRDTTNNRLKAGWEA